MPPCEPSGEVHAAREVAVGPDQCAVREFCSGKVFRIIQGADDCLRQYW